MPIFLYSLLGLYVDVVPVRLAACSGSGLWGKARPPIGRNINVACGSIEGEDCYLAPVIGHDGLPDPVWCSWQAYPPIGFGLRETRGGTCGTPTGSYHDRKIRRVRDLSCGDTKSILKFEVSIFLTFQTGNRIDASRLKSNE